MSPSGHVGGTLKNNLIIASFGFQKHGRENICFLIFVFRCERLLKVANLYIRCHDGGSIYVRYIIQSPPVYINFSFAFFSQNHLIYLGFTMNMNVQYMDSDHMLFPTVASVLCLIYNLSPSARACISDTTRPLITCSNLFNSCFSKVIFSRKIFTKIWSI